MNAGRDVARIVLLGYGAINRQVEQLLRAAGGALMVVGVVVRNTAAVDAAPSGARTITRPKDLAELAPDVVLEAASPQALREWGEVALRTARRLVVSSATAFTDDDLLRRLRRAARESGSQLVLSPGAIAGVDALSALAPGSIREVRHRIVKPPRGWKASAEVATSAGPTLLFSGSAREAASRYPLNTNVAVVSALATTGLDATVVELVADPAATANSHEITVTGEFGSVSVHTENAPLAANPASSQLAARALARLAKNEVAEFVI